MAQNIYDDPEFLSGYSAFPRSSGGLEATAEWPALRALLPTIAGKRVVELGCGFGHLSNWLAQEGARTILALDLSEKMLARAKAENAHPAIRYDRADLDDFHLDPASADLVVSSMTLHYIADFRRILQTVGTALVPGGRLVFSVEHPIYATRAEPEWVKTADGRRGFVITDYLVEGRRITNWIVDGIVKYHRTIGSMHGMLRDAGFSVDAIEEWKPDDAQLRDNPAWRETELVRPMFILYSATKSSQ